MSARYENPGMGHAGSDGKPYDAIIVGSGAGGSAAAYRLVNAGLCVLLLEKGGELPRNGSTLDVAKIADGRFKNREIWLDGQGAEITPEEYYNLGGKTKWYGAALLRFAREEFDGDAELGLLPWPIGYEDLAPYYDEAERLLAVRYFPVEPDLRRLLSGFLKTGKHWRAYKLPLGLDPAILENPLEAKHFDGFSSKDDLKSDAETSLLARVRGQPNLTVLTGKSVTSFLPGEDSLQRIAGVICKDGSSYLSQRVLLAAGALSSPRVLQTYFTQSGLNTQLACAQAIGRNYKCHLKSFLLAFSLDKKTDFLRKTVLLLNPRFPHSSVQTLGWIDGELLSAQLPAAAPRWFAQFCGKRVYGFFVQTEEASSPDNRVIQTEAYPQLDYDPARTPAALRKFRQVTRSFRWHLLQAGYASGVKMIPITGTAHACGTLVAGKDPTRSVVNAQGRVHDLENVYVVDGSVLPRINRVNPSLTIYAWALRVADGISKAH